MSIKGFITKDGEVHRYSYHALDDIPEHSEQVQADLLQNDPTAQSYVQGRTHYSVLEYIASAIVHQGSRLIFQIDLENYYPLCIEINGTKFWDLMSYAGDEDASLWLDGGGMGFYIKKLLENMYEMHIDTARYGPISKASVIAYTQKVSKILPEYYLPIASANHKGIVEAEYVEDPAADGYRPCVIDPEGMLFAKEYAQVHRETELSVSALKAYFWNDTFHVMFTDSIAEDFPVELSVTLPVHMWPAGMDYSSTPYKRLYYLESADGTTWLVRVTSQGIHSWEKIASSGGPSPMVVNFTETTNENGERVFSTDKTFAEIKAAIDAGVEITASVDGTILEVSYVDDWAIEFIKSVPLAEIYNCVVVTLWAVVYADNDCVVGSYEVNLPSTAIAVLPPEDIQPGQTLRLKECILDDTGSLEMFVWEAADMPTDDHINALIDAKLGVIENGAY